jgi:putative ABC transport system substrate-binding protein
MKRREFITLLGGAAVAWPLAARAAGKLYRIGFLWDTPAVWPDALEGFRRGLRDLGWIEGQNIAIEYRWAEGRFDRLAALAEDLVKLKVDVIVAPTSIYAEAARRATSSIPIVFASHADPIGTGHVASLARPGGNVTGLSLMMTETNVKGLELLKEVVPQLTRVAVIWDPATPSHTPGIKAIETAAPSVALQLQSLPVRTVEDLESAFEAMIRERAQAFLVLSTPLYMGAARPFADLAIKHKLPSMFGPREHAEAGGLLSYSPDRNDVYRRAATYVDKILKGAKPSDLPVQQPTRFDLVINLKTARAIGLDIAPTLLVRADKVIE